ncbi:MAG TPA: pectinesterase family protein [Phycisphaerae bacterium]
MSFRKCLLPLSACLALLLPAAMANAQTAPKLFPADGAGNVNPDTHLTITFSVPPTIGSSGQVRIYDARDGKLVDTLDMSIPAGPGRGGAPAVRGATVPGFTYTYAPSTATNANTAPGTASSSLPATPNSSQLTIIGGFSDAFHFYPIIVHDNTATIYPHNNILTYGKTYYVQIDKGVLNAGEFAGVAGASSWTFSTKKAGPAADAARLVVAADGSGDFNTVQGAVDTVPDKSAKRTTIFIRNGFYEELVYFRNKTNITFLGEDRKKVIVTYGNYEGFNAQPAGYTSNEKPGTFPYRRAAFFPDNSQGIQIVNLTIRNPSTGGQAEALLFMGGKNIVSNVDLYGNTDTIQFNDSVYVTDSFIEGAGDFLWGRGPVFFNNCILSEKGQNNPMGWVRSTSASHGFVYSNCRFQAPNATGAGPVMSRNTAAYPNSEMVLLNCSTQGINPVGWTLAGDTTNQHYWEFNTTNASDGKPADVSRRVAGSRQLTMEKDAETIKNYSDPSWVLGGWKPVMAPLILSDPAAVTAAAGQTATFTAAATAIPAPTYQWLKNGTPISGATEMTLKLSGVKGADAGSYTLKATNGEGSIVSAAAVLTVQ